MLTDTNQLQFITCVTRLILKSVLKVWCNIPIFFLKVLHFRKTSIRIKGSLKATLIIYYGIIIERISCRTVALRKNFLLTDRRATVPPIVKTVYLLRTKNCARFGLNFSIFLLCQVKIPDEINTRHVYLWGKNINRPLDHFY